MQKKSRQSAVLGIILHGEMVKLVSRLDISQGKRGGFSEPWVKVRKTRKLTGYVEYKDLLLLDRYQKNLWLHDHRLFRIHVSNTRVFFDKKSLDWLSGNNFVTQIKLARGAQVWASKVTRDYIFFRYLEDTPFYITAYIRRKDARPVK